MAAAITGIHHVSALAQSPSENHGFYTRVLGLRLVKKTVNFDDPTTYHLYFGDHAGTPGTLLTYFPHPHAKRGVHGSPEILETLLRVPAGSLTAWAERFESMGVASERTTVAGEERLAFGDPDGMHFALRETGAGASSSDGPRIEGIDGFRIRVPSIQETGEFLEEALGFQASGGGRFSVNDDESSDFVELEGVPDDPLTRMGAGTVHHAAWRVPDEETLRLVADRVRSLGVGVTPVKDRQYFRSIYFRVPGGVIFEVATDGPGFDADEPLGALGRALKLPPQYEERRAELEAHLVPLGAD